MYRNIHYKWIINSSKPNIYCIFVINFPELLMEQRVEMGYLVLKETVEKFLKHSAYSVINFAQLFSFIKVSGKNIPEVEFQSDEDDMEDEM